MYINILLAAGLFGLASAQSYHQPGAQTFGALYTPDLNTPVTRGETFKITWDPTGHTTDGSTVSLVLCHGGSGNCVNAPTALVSGVPASAASYNWNVPCSLEPGVKSTDTGYGMLIIVDSTGEFQYSTQFSVLAGTKCGSGASNSTTHSTTSTTYSATTTTYSTTTTGSFKTYTTTSAWVAPNNYTYTTTTRPTSPSTVHHVTTTSAATTTPSASPSASQFHGAATKIGGSAAALMVAAGAAFFAL